MALSGQGIQVVEVQEHQFYLDKGALEYILLREEIRDLPVVLVSVAGAYRGGKSFLLNFFLRYLTATQSARDDGSWLGEESMSLEGFSWRGGSTRNTTGILMWSEPIICTQPSGKKVAVLLMDTQGTFDSSSTVNECSTIFALSTLLASVQMYNLSQNIQEDHLQHLHLFTEYGKLVQEKGNGKAFQVLKFLVRDWPYDWEFAYGFAGGEEFLQKRLQCTPGMSKELKEVRSHIRSCFEKVSCFLMPHPGRRVNRPDFKGKISEIDEEFTHYLKELVSSTFSPDKLEPKVIHGKVIKAQDLFTYFDLYMSVFRSGSIPHTSSIMKVTTDAGLLTALREGLAQYEENMETDCGESAKCVPPIDIKVLHERYKALALYNFTIKKKMGTKKDAKPYYKKLSNDINNRLEKHIAVNTVKQQKISEAARITYDDEIKKITKGELFCVHPLDLEVIHYNAFKVAEKVFHAGRKRFTFQPDPETDVFKRTLDGKFQLLKASNDTNNKQVISELRDMYWQHMEKTTTADPALTKLELQKEHDDGLAMVLESFKQRRTRADNYQEDFYKSQLIKKIYMRYEAIKGINESANKKAVNAALAVYNKHISSRWDQQKQNLHPDHLEEDHETAIYLALSAFHPNNESGEFDDADEDEVTLLKILTSRYDELFETNQAMNRVSIQSAFNVFVETFEDRRRPSLWWLLIIPMIVSLASHGAFRKASKEDAKVEFYKKRRAKGPESTDVYLQRLMQMIDASK